MMDKDEAKRFMKFVRDNSSFFTKNRLAQSMNVPLQTFNNRLLGALTLLQETPPDFFRGKKRKITEENIDTVRSTGQGGHAKRIIIPQRLFNELGWEINDKIRFRPHGKRKLIIEKIEDAPREKT